MAKQLKNLSETKSVIVDAPASSGRYFLHLLVFAFSFVLFFNSTFNDYNLDDELVTQNHRLTSKGISAIPEIFRTPYYFDESGYRYEYRPLVLTTFAMEHSLFGDNAFYSHLINVLLYAFSCLLLFVLLKKLFDSYYPLFSFFVVLLFIAHPTHTEVVDSIKNRDEILVLLFGLATMYVSLLYAEGKWYYLLIAPLLLLLAMLAKPTAAVFVFLIPFSVLMFRSVKFWQLILLTVLLYLPAVVFARIYFLSQQVLILALLLGILSVLYFLKNASREFSFNEILSSVRTKQESTEVKSSVGETATMPLAFWILGIISALSLVALSCIGILLPNFWLLGGSLSILLLAYFLLSENWKAIILPAIAIALSVFLVHYQLTTTAMDAALLVLLFVPFLSENKGWKISALIGLAVYAFATVIFLHSFFVLAVLVFAVFINRKLLPLSLLMLAGFAAAVLFTLYELTTQQNLNFSFLAFLILSIVFGLLWRKQQKLVLRFSVWLIPLAFIFLFSENSVRFIQAEKVHVDYQLKALQFTRGVDLTPANSHRPLKFLESPVTELDAINIRLGTAMIVLGNYLKLALVPYPLNFYYGYPYISATDIFSFLPILVLVVHILLAALGLMWIRKKPVLSYAVIFYLASISIFSTLPVPIPGMMGDRFLLIPSLGFCLAVVVLLYQYFEKDEGSRQKKFQSLNPVFKYSLLALLLIYSALTFSRNMQWKDHVTLFRHDLAVSDNSAQANNLLGLHLFIASVKEQNSTIQNQMREEAIVHFKRALELYPRLMNAAYDMGRCYDAMGKQKEAYDAYTMTTQIDSSFFAPYFALALYEHNTGNLNAAVGHYEKFIRKYPFQMEAYANLSFAYFSMEQFDKSIEVNKRALRIYPNAFEPTVNIGKTFGHIHQRDSALYYFEQANRIQPGNADIQQMINELKK